MNQLEQNDAHKQPILIVGLPRSGTTWVGEVFSSARNTRYIFEPDNEKLSPLAWFCKSDLHRFPYLTSKDELPVYYQLWQAAIYGMGSTWLANQALGLFFRQKADELESLVGNKSGFVYIDAGMYRVNQMHTKPYQSADHPVVAFLTRQLLAGENAHLQNRRIIIKSVHASLAMDWISSHFPVRVVFILRNPYSLYASYKRMKMPDSFRNLLLQETYQRDRLQYLSELKQTFMVEREDPIAFQIMLMYKIIEKQLSTHPEWMLISHDRLCITPHESYKNIFDEIGLAWSTHTNSKIDALNNTGKGFEAKRISKQQPFKWKTEMQIGEQRVIEKWVDVFNLGEFFRKYINL